MRVIWAPLAREQVADAFNFILAERPAAAVRWFNHVVESGVPTGWTSPLWPLA